MKISRVIIVTLIVICFNFSYAESIFDVSRDKRCWCEDGTTVKKNDFFDFKEENQRQKEESRYRDNELEIIICDYDSRGRLQCKDAKEY